MPSSSSKKAQFFVLTTVVIVGVFYTLSKYINPYSFIDTSEAATGGESFFFDNVKGKAIETVELSPDNDLMLERNLEEYKEFVERTASDKGYNLNFNYEVTSNSVNVSMVLMSEKRTLKADFTIPR